MQIYLKMINTNISGETGTSCKEEDVIEIYNLKEGKIVLISLRRFSFSEYSN